MNRMTQLASTIVAASVLSRVSNAAHAERADRGVGFGSPQPQTVDASHAPPSGAARARPCNVQLTAHRARPNARSAPATQYCSASRPDHGDAR